MIFMLTTTLIALTLTVITNVRAMINGTAENLPGTIIQISFAAAVFVLGIIVAKQGLRKLRKN